MYMAEDVGRMILTLARLEEEAVFKKLREVGISDKWADDVAQRIIDLTSKKKELIVKKMHVQSRGNQTMYLNEPRDCGIQFWLCVIYESQFSCATSVQTFTLATGSSVGEHSHGEMKCIGGVKIQSRNGYIHIQTGDDDCTLVMQKVDGSINWF